MGYSWVLTLCCARTCVRVSWCRALRASEDHSLEHVARLNLIYRSGYDPAGRAVIVVMVGHLPTFEVPFDDIVMYLYRVIEDVVETDYTVVLVNGAICSKNTPSFGRVARALRIMPHT